MAKGTNFRSFTIDIETITPVAIGNGDILSPYTDYVFADEDIRVLDKNKLAAEIAQKDEDKPDGTKRLMDEYVDMLYWEMNNNRSSFNLKKDFIEKDSKLGIKSEILTHRSHPYFGLNPNIRQEIKCIVKDNDRPYIPGSSIKGAIKGALLYHWFNNEGKSQFENIMKTLLNTYKKAENKIKQIERIASRDHIGRSEANEIKRLKRQIWKNDRQTLDKAFQSAIEELLTKEHRYLPRDFNHLRLKDSRCFYTDDILIQQTKRLHYAKGRALIPVNTEAIKVELITDFSLSIVNSFTHKSLQFFNKKKPIENLFNRINQFSKDNILMEFHRLNTFPGYRKAKGRDRDLFEEYKNVLENIKEQLDNALPNEAFLCLGAGKSFFYNSIGLAVHHTEEKDLRFVDKETPLFRKFFKLYFLGKDGQKNFPLTRPVTDIGEPMGWVKLSWKNS